MASRRCSWGGAFFACWLTLWASGDDFHLLRMAAPFLPVETPADPFPLDDPNTDFTEADDSGGSLLPRAPSRPAGMMTRARPLVAATPVPPLLTTPAAGVSLPLRC